MVDKKVEVAVNVSGYWIGTESTKRGKLKLIP